MLSRINFDTVPLQAANVQNVATALHGSGDLSSENPKPLTAFQKVQKFITEPEPQRTVSASVDDNSAFDRNWSIAYL